MKKSILFSAITFLLFSCGDGGNQLNSDSLRTDSALKAQEKQSKVVAPIAGTDTLKVVALPPVMEGDLVFQNSEDEQSVAFGKASHSKYNNVGLIFIRPSDNQYMVMEVLDSLHATPLKDWVDRGEGKHFALVRLKLANQILNEKKTKALKTMARSMRGRKFDPYYNWSDEALYPSEMVWKIYKTGGNVNLCEPGTLGQFDLTGTLVKQQMKNKYGTTIPTNEKAVTPDDLIKSPKLELIFER